MAISFLPEMVHVVQGAGFPAPHQSSFEPQQLHLAPDALLMAQLALFPSRASWVTLDLLGRKARRE